MKTPTPASDHAERLGLVSRWREERVDAEQAIRAMGPDRIPFLLQVFDEQRRGYLHRNKIHTTLGLLIILLLAYGFAAIAAWWPNTLFSKLAGYLAFLPIGFVLYRMFTLKATRLQNNAMSLLTRMADKSDIGLLVDLLVTVQGGSARELDTALTRILPQLQASDANLLLPKHRAILANVLPYRHSTTPEAAAFTIALLKTLQQIGDGSFVEPVTKLARIKEEGWKDRVQMAALECLPYLQAFAQKEQKSGTLVRAASAPEGLEQSAILVRPATSQPSEPAFLLRSMDQEEPE